MGVAYLSLDGFLKHRPISRPNLPDLVLADGHPNDREKWWCFSSVILYSMRPVIYFFIAKI